MDLLTYSSCQVYIRKNSRSCNIVVNIVIIVVIIVCTCINIIFISRYNTSNRTY